MAEPITMRREGYRLVPCSLTDEDALRDLPEGRDLTVTVTRSRRPKHHRFFMALLKKVCENHETYKRPEQLLLWLKIRLGYVEEVRFHDDKIWWVAKSVSFHAMGQDDFKQFFDAALDVIVSEVIPGLDQYQLLQEVTEMIGFDMTELSENNDGV